MLVLSLTECPPALRGDLTGWLTEIDTGVYVGRVSQRVREALWQRITCHLKTGRAVMVFAARNEQRMDFRIHNAAWEPIDFDGIKLMLRPNAQRQMSKENLQAPCKPGYSIAAKMRMAKRMAKPKASSEGFPERFVIIDLETSGLQPKTHEIIELGAIKVFQGQEEAHFQALIKPAAPIPQHIQTLTGISPEMLHHHGQNLSAALPDFLDFLEELPIVSHNMLFDVDFLKSACSRTGLPLPANRRIDTLSMARRYVTDLPNHKLPSLMAHFNLPYPIAHRSLEDCRATLMLLNKLIEIRSATR